MTEENGDTWLTVRHKCVRGIAPANKEASMIHRFPGREQRERTEWALGTPRVLDFTLGMIVS